MYDLFNPLSMDVDNPWRTNNHCRFTSEPVQVRAAVTQISIAIIIVMLLLVIMEMWRYDG